MHDDFDNYGHNDGGADYTDDYDDDDDDDGQCKVCTCCKSPFRHKKAEQ